MSRFIPPDRAVQLSLTLLCTIRLYLIHRLGDISMTDYFFLNWFWLRLSELWADPAGKIFIISVLAYTSTYLFFAGYLGRFSGGIGSLSVNISEFSITDLLAIAPMGLNTFYLVFKAFLSNVVKVVFLNFLLPSTVGIGAFFLVRYFTYFNFAPWIALPSLLTWIGIPYFMVVKHYKLSTFPGILLFLLTSIGAFFFTAGMGSLGHAQQGLVQASGQPDPFFAFIFQIMIDFMVVLVLFAIPLMILVLGAYGAEIAAKERILSQVARLSLKQPIPLPTNYRKFEIKQRHRKNKGLWISGPALNISIEPDVFVYMYHKDSLPLYLIASFRKFTLFYVPNKPDDLIIRGRLVSVSNDLIYSIELQYANVITEEDQANNKNHL